MAPSLYAGEIEITPPLPNADMNDYEARLQRRSVLRWHVLEAPAGEPFTFSRHAVAITGPGEASEAEWIVEDIQAIIDAFPDREFAGYIQKTPEPPRQDAGASRIVVLDRRVVEIPGELVPPDPARPASGLCGRVAAALAAAGFPERTVNEYGSVIECGWRVEGSNRDGWARVEHKMPEPDLTDPDRLSSDAMYLTRLHWRDAYSAALTDADFDVEHKTVMGNRSILLACPGGVR